MEQGNTILIVTGGKLNCSFLKEVYYKNTFDIVIAVDNGLFYLNEADIIPHYLVGDFDTAKKELLNQYMNRTDVIVKRYCPEKDATDTQLAIELAIELNAKEVVILGGLGGRFDHSIINIQLLLLLLKHKIKGSIQDEKNHLFLTDKSIKLKKKNCFGMYFSLIPITDRVTKITLIGMKYPLVNAVLEKGSSLGISNEIIQEEAQVLFEDGILLIAQTQD